MSGSDGGRLVVDLTGLLLWYRYAKAATGIQRVTERIVIQPMVVDDPQIRFAARTAGSAQFFELDKQSVALLGSPQSHPRGRDYVRRMHDRIAKEASLTACLGEAHATQLFGLVRARIRSSDGSRDPPGLKSIQLGRDDVLLSLGEFWCTRGHIRFIARLKKVQGFRYVQMIHDLIAVSHPNVCHGYYGAELRRQLPQVLEIADAFLAGSRFVKNELAALLARGERGLREIGIVPMGWDFAQPARAGSAAQDEIILSKYGLEREKYFLQVGTIEARKNHLLVVRALNTLRSERGLRPPTCVFVGNDGWGAKELYRELRLRNDLDGTIKILRNVSDGELVALYRNCCFTVFPSLAEGWGLPVQESLFFGKPCLASAADSIPEAGLDLAEYFDPKDQEAFTNKLEQWITDDEYRTKTAKLIERMAETRRIYREWRESAQYVVEFAMRIARMRS